ncbi:hypothetical protein TNCV_1672821 [Trichonephila clavipes]|nr:hypothetical protein TNCV_1672821 [Trichonephila clavipes]
MYNKELVPTNGREKIANCINLNLADISKLIEDYVSAEVSEHETHTSDKIQRENFDNDLTQIIKNGLQRQYSFQQNENKGSLNPLSHSSQSTAANVIETNPGSHDMKRQR